MRIGPGLWIENLKLGGKGLLLTGTAPSNPRMVVRTVIDGSGETAPTVWVGGAEARVTRLRGLTIQGGMGALVDTPYRRRIGGGVLCESGELRIDRCRVVDNGPESGSAAGGGIYVGETGELLLQASTLARNDADRGGGIAVEGGSAVLRQVRISGNTAPDDGAGAHVTNWGRLEADQCSFENNRTTAYYYSELGGGAISIDRGGEVRLDRSDLIGSRALQGGAVANAASFEMRGGTIVGNEANMCGGALQVFAGGRTLLDGVVIAKNWALCSGGAIQNDGELAIDRSTIVMNGGGLAIIEQSDEARSAIRNSILWRNGPFPSLDAGSGRMIVRYSDVQGGHRGEGNIDSDPLFCALPCGDLDASIAAESPCIGAGVDGANIGAGEVGCDSGYEPEHRVWSVPGDRSGIQAAIDSSCDGDTVRVSPGVWNESIDFEGKSIVLTGTAPEDSATVDRTIILGAGDSVVRISKGEPEGAAVSGLRIRGGEGTYLGECIGSYGAGLFVSNATLAIRHCVIDSNEVVYYRGGGVGSGLWAKRSKLIVSDCRIERNRATWRGGGVAIDNSEARLLHCRIENNWTSFWNGSGEGGGVSLRGGSTEIIACRVADNRAADGEGGGIRATSGARADIQNSVIFGNESRRGEYDLPRGGGLSIDDSSAVKLQFSIVSKNRGAAAEGGGVAVRWPGTLETRGAVIWSNASGGIFDGDDIRAIWNPRAVRFSYSLVPEEWTGVGVVHGAPYFITWENHEFVLSPGRWGEDDAVLPRSPCIDAGPPLLNDGLEWPPGYDNNRRSDMGIYGGPLGPLWKREEEN